MSLSLLASGFECCTNSKRKRNLTEAKFVQLQLNELIRDSMGHFQGRPSPPAQWGGSFRIARILQLFRAGFRAGAAKPVKRRCYLRKHRVTPCRKQRCAPFPARLEPLGATRGPALLPSPGLPWDLGAGARNGRSPSPDHRISRFAPGRIYVVRHPCAGQDPLRLLAQEAPPDAGRWTGQVHRPQRRGTTLFGMPGFTTVPDPKLRSTRTDPGPVKVTFGASPEKRGAAKAADGRHP